MRSGPVIGLLSMSLLGCASQVINESSAPLDPDAFAAVFTERSQCWGAWGALLRDWESHGGGFKPSMRETREQIAMDEESDFARVVRRAWDRQAMAQPGRWQWPVADERSRVVLSDATGEDYVPANCEGIFWLDDLVWDELRFDGGNPARARRFVETPVGMAWDSPNAQHWTMYWLFAKVGLNPSGASNP